jgi:DNA transposition AAA+ family ATPase
MGEFLDQPAKLSPSLRRRKDNAGITPDNYQILSPSSNHIYSLVLLGMPGLDKRLQRVAQLYSRIGFVHEIAPLSQQETRFFLQQRWSHRVSADSEDFTDLEAVATIIRITQGNMRLIDRLMKQVERVLAANQLTVVTKEVVETARQNLIIGFN